MHAVGDIVVIKATGKVIATHDAHGESYEVQLDQRDFMSDRTIHIDPDEISKPAPLWLLQHDGFDEQTVGGIFSTPQSAMNYYGLSFPDEVWEERPDGSWHSNGVGYSGEISKWELDNG